MTNNYIYVFVHACYRNSANTDFQHIRLAAPRWRWRSVQIVVVTRRTVPAWLKRRWRTAKDGGRQEDGLTLVRRLRWWRRPNSVV